MAHEAPRGELQGRSAHATSLGAQIPVGVPDDADSVVIDCDRCSMRGIGCGDCVVTVLLGGPPYGVPLDEHEQRAIDVLADAGLVPRPCGWSSRSKPGTSTRETGRPVGCCGRCDA